MKVDTIRIRNSGADILVELNIRVKHDVVLTESHNIAHEIEDRIRIEIPRSKVHVHIEPDKVNV
jgi:divalent metal cation (Fe/Co/Zn/Cd) transporter